MTRTCCSSGDVAADGGGFGVGRRRGDVLDEGGVQPCRGAHDGRGNGHPPAAPDPHRMGNVSAGRTETVRRSVRIWSTPTFTAVSAGDHADDRYQLVDEGWN